MQAVDQPGVEQLIQIPLIRIGLRPKIFEGLPEDHSPLVNTVEFQLKARQDISTKKIGILNDYHQYLYKPDHQLENMVQEPGT